MFKFKLQSVLDYRLNMEEKILNEFSEVKRYLEEQKTILRMLISERESLINDLRNMKSSAMRADDIGTHVQYIENIRIKEKEQKDVIHQAKEQVEKKRIMLIEAVKNRKIMENLRDKHAEAYKKDFNEMEQKDSDEMSVLKFRQERNMKKIIIGAQILIAVLILVKVASVFGILKEGEYFTEATIMATQALAESKTPAMATKQQTTPVVAQKTPPPAKDAMEDILTQQRDLAQALTAKKAELDNRENVLRADEQRLIALRKEITEKMAILKAQEEKLAAQLDTTREEDIKRFKEMAKVYENTPPAKAGPMLEKLDTKTAAGITMHMKKDKAGALWAYITPQKAVDVTKEITRNGGYRTE